MICVRSIIGPWRRIRLNERCAARWPVGRSGMEFKDTQDEAAFRNQVRTFIRQNLPARYADPEMEAYATLSQDAEDFRKQWRTALGRQGWIAPHWPKEYGGAGMGVTEQF